MTPQDQEGFIPEFEREPTMEEQTIIDAAEDSKPKPWYMNPSAEESLTWIRKKIGVPEDAQMFSGDKTIAGQLHVICSHADGYMKYITSYKCNDKQGEIARQSVEIAQLNHQIAEVESQLVEVNDGEPVIAMPCSLNRKRREENASLRQQVSVLQSRLAETDVERNEKLTEQRQRLCAEHDETLAELSRVREVARSAIESAAHPADEDLCDEGWLDEHKFKIVDDGCWRIEICPSGLHITVTVDQEGGAKTLSIGWETSSYGASKIGLVYLLEDQPTKGRVRKLLEALS